MAGRDTIVPGRFSLADVALYSIAEFGVSVGQTIDPALKNVSAWLDKVKERDSAQA
jgi:glutathione S-transferase